MAAMTTRKSAAREMKRAMMVDLMQTAAGTANCEACRTVVEPPSRADCCACGAPSGRAPATIADQEKTSRSRSAQNQRADRRVAAARRRRLGFCSGPTGCLPGLRARPGSEKRWRISQALCRRHRNDNESACAAKCRGGKSAKE